MYYIRKGKKQKTNDNAHTVKIVICVPVIQSEIIMNVYIKNVRTGT